MKPFKNFTIKMVKMNFVLWKITIKHNFDWKYEVLFFFWVCIYITYQIKKCVYIIKKKCVYMCMWGCLDKYISVATWPPNKNSWLRPLLKGHLYPQWMGSPHVSIKSYEIECNNWIWWNKKMSIWKDYRDK